MQITTSLRFTTWLKKHLWLLSPLMAITLKVPCRTWNSSLACCSTRCTYTHPDPVSFEPGPPALSPPTPLSPRVVGTGTLWPPC